MKLYNSMTGRKEEFIPLDGKNVKMYACGITVYDLSHIGHARQAIAYAMVADYLRYRGYNVKYVRNYTDVDDKIIDRANKLGKDPLEFSREQIEETEKDMANLHITDADVKPKASENIENIIEFVQGLIDKGHAYPAENGDVYFNVRSFPGYGKLSHRKVDELLNGVRKDVEEGKHDPIDFALWKAAKPGEISWKSPWGEGRPGWHIECSVMSNRYLGETIDIHAGGQDLAFPHHENEIAQSEARSGKTFSNYWVHNGYININNEKMSKSKGNFFTVRDISKKYDLEIVRFFMLSAHYRNPVNFSDEMLNQAKAGLERLYNAKEKLEFTISNLSESAIKDEEKELINELESYKDKFINAMEDDLNTADAVSAIFELSKFINTNVNETSSLEFAKMCLDKFNELTGVLNIVNKKNDDILDKDIEELIQKRADAKKNKDFKLADEIRQELLDKGIVLEDTRQGTKWKRV